MFDPCPSCTGFAKCFLNDVCIKEYEKEYPYELAKKIWTTVYPERTPWDNLLPDTKDEWARWALAAYKIIKEECPDTTY